MTSPNPSKPQDIEALRKRYTDLDRRKAAAEANLKTATENLEALKEQARRTYGTDNLDELRAKLDEMKRENDRKRSEYQQHLDQIEARLSDIEREYGTARIGAADRP